MRLREVSARRNNVQKLFQLIYVDRFFFSFYFFRRNVIQKLFHLIYVFMRAIYFFFKTLVVPLNTLEPQKKFGGALRLCFDVERGGEGGVRCVCLQCACMCLRVYARAGVCACFCVHVDVPVPVCKFGSHLLDNITFSYAPVSPCPLHTTLCIPLLLCMLTLCFVHVTSGGGRGSFSQMSKSNVVKMADLPPMPGG